MRTLLVINATLDDRTRDGIIAGRIPRKDYLELQRALAADILDLGAIENWRWTRLARSLLGAGAAQSLLAWVQSGRYDAIFSDRETTGFALAALAKLRARRTRLTMIGHLLSPPKKRLLFRLLCLSDRIDNIVVHSSLQHHVAVDKLGLAREQVTLVPYQCDGQFWHPDNKRVKNQICSAGLEYRDYETLIKAVDGLDVDVVIAAASLWSKHRVSVAQQARVRVDAFDYEALRELYAESLFVVVPLQDVENQAGITVILEAMAMGKAVIVSHTHGQMDVVRDRRSRSRSDPARPTQPDWARRLGASEDIAQGQTGIYVAPGNPDQLRRAIAFLLQHPDQAALMGANGRRLVEATMSLEHFTERLAEIIRGDSPLGDISVTGTRSGRTLHVEA